MPCHWKKIGLPILAILIPWITLAQPAYIPEIEKSPPRRVLWSQRDEKMVDITKACPGIFVELRYATERNFTGKQVYPQHARALIRKSVAARLRKVQEDLHKQGYGLKIWDAYRPAWAQDILWKSTDNPSQYLANPAQGGSYHTWGASVDVTLVDLQGHEQKMASDFDDFSPAAKSEYIGADSAVASRMTILRTAMKNAGFGGIHDEWWHFTAGDAGLFAPVDMPLEEGGKY
jgi:D-alanyl-D-alanine dipeptidase